MIIPDTVKILGYTYQVKKVNDRLKNNGVNTAGSCSCVNQTIWIDTASTQDQQESTFIHEILEALDYHLNLGLGDAKICPLESGLYQVLKDNFLTKE